MVISLPHLKPGGAERTASVLANYLVSRGDEVFVLLMYNREHFYELDSRVTLLEPDSRKFRFGRALYLIYAVTFMHRQLVRIRPDVIVALGYIAITLLAAIGTAGKVVVSGRSSPSRVRFPGNPFLNFTYRFLHKALSFKVSALIAQTQRAREMLQLKYPKKQIEVIPNFLRPLTESSVERLDQVITVGRCEKEKGHDYLIRAFTRLNAPNWKLVIVGDGSQSASLRALSSSLGIADRFVITGFTKDVDHYLSQSKIFAFPSLHEGFPNALLEAMANPLPCVSFDCEAGPSDLITHGVNGFLVPTGDIGAMTIYLQRLVDDETLRSSISAKALEKRASHALPIIGEQYRRFLFQLTANK